MKNVKLQVVGFLSFLAVAASPLVSFADTYATSTASADFAGALSDVGILIAAGTAGALGGWAALTGLGFGVRHFKKWVSGRKF